MFDNTRSVPFNKKNPKNLENQVQPSRFILIKCEATGDFFAHNHTANVLTGLFSLSKIVSRTENNNWKRAEAQTKQEIPSTLKGEIN